jgi:prepilin-type N-terminal cleavage/methylation domain-containing protein
MIHSYYKKIAELLKNYVPRKSKEGFTLIETLVAVFIVALALVGPLSIAQKGLASAVLSRDRATAAYLAQDVFEYIHNVRDENWLKDVEWINGSSGPQDPNRDPGGNRAGLDRCVVDEPVSVPTDLQYYNFCVIDTTLGHPASVTSCPLWNACPVLLQDTQTGTPPTYLFGYGAGWTPTPFVRKVRIVRNNLNGESGRDEALIEVTVTWKSVFGDQSYVINSALYNWF